MTTPTASHELTSVKLVQDSFWKLVRNCYSNQILNQGVRCDGRLLGELRPISCEINIFNELHGSSLFRRGETEVNNFVVKQNVSLMSLRYSLLSQWMYQTEQLILILLLQ